MLQDYLNEGLDCIKNKGYEFFYIRVSSGEDIYADSVKSFCRENRVCIFEFKEQYYLFKMQEEVPILDFLKSSITGFIFCKFGLVAIPCGLSTIGLSFLWCSNIYFSVFKLIAYLTLTFISLKFGMICIIDSLKIMRCNGFDVKDSIYYTLIL